MAEEWLPIKGYEGLYEVSSFGRVKSLNYGRTAAPKLLRQHLRGEYLSVTLYKDKSHSKESVHRLVASTFHPNPSWLPQVNHIDEDKLNNRADNLEWVTAKANTNYVTAIQRAVAKKSKKVIAKDPNGDIIHRFSSLSEAERQGYSHGNISECCRGRRSHHKGLSWEYA